MGGRYIVVRLQTNIINDDRSSQYRLGTYWSQFKVRFPEDPSAQLLLPPVDTSVTSQGHIGAEKDSAQYLFYHHHFRRYFP